MDRFYVTTPIYYVNDLPHVGHIYTTVMADIFARYHRLMGRQVYFLTGTDEHGQKIDRAARKLGMNPKELADTVVARYHELWEKLAITNDDFIRTTEDRHKRAVREMIRRMVERGDIYKGEYTGWYCSGCEAFYPETQLVDGKCPDHGHPVERLSEPSYFFRLSKYQDALLKWYQEHPECIMPRTRYNEVVSFVRSGLTDLSISRASLRWGVPWPGDPEHVVYVWLDALTNYISALGFGSEDDTLFKTFWPADLHLVGKDILRFHCVYWPAFLMSAGLPLPKTVFGHGWWQAKGTKMSKSLGNVVRPDRHIEVFGPDALRYFLAREMAFGQDAGFSDEAFLERYNSELVNQLGNAAARLFSLWNRHLADVKPVAAGNSKLEEAFSEGIGRYKERMEGLEPHRALEEAWRLIALLNGFLQEKAPWALAKDHTKKVQLVEVLSVGLECLRLTALMIEPFMPISARKLWEWLGLGEVAMSLGEKDGARWGGIAASSGIGKAGHLFPRIRRWATPEDAVELESSSKKKKKKKEEKKVGGKELVTIEDFAKLELKVGVVLSCERVPNTSKLLKLKVDLGEDEPRQIVAGIAESYAPEDLVGKRIVVVANLKPAKIRGVESRGMLLAAEDQGKAHLLLVDGEPRPGSQVR